jgi:hypothetical protein
LNRVCPNCEQIVGLDWSLCAWCGRDFERPTAAPFERPAAVPAVADITREWWPNAQYLAGDTITPTAAKTPLASAKTVVPVENDPAAEVVAPAGTSAPTGFTAPGNSSTTKKAATKKIV